VVTSFAPALLNVAFIACGLCLPAALLLSGHDRTLALAAGVWLGGGLQVMAQWPSLRAIDMSPRPRLELGHPGVREVLRRLTPALIGIGVYYLDVFIARRMLSSLDLGATSYFTFALRLCDFPQGIFIMALQAATLPSLSRLAARGDLNELGNTLSFGLRLSLFVAIPATVLLVTLAEPIVALVFQRGEFGADAARQTARALVAQGVAIWMVAIVRQLLSGFYALGDTRTPALVAVVDLIAFVTLALALRDRLGHVGIGLAVSGARLLQMCLLWTLLGRKTGTLQSLRVLRSGIVTAVCCVPGTVGALWLAEQLTWPGAGAWARALPGLVASTAFVLVFVAVAALARHPELAAVSRSFRRRTA
jgi:putative peptidoglycan lipid II flippase